MNEEVINELNKLQVVDSRCGGGELEYVLIKDTKEHRERLNYLLCLTNVWACSTGRYSPTMHEFLNHCKDECDGYLDVTYLVYNLAKNIDLKRIGFNQNNNEWELVA